MIIEIQWRPLNSRSDKIDKTRDHNSSMFIFDLLDANTMKTSRYT